MRGAAAGRPAKLPASGRGIEHCIGKCRWFTLNRYLWTLAASHRESEEALQKRLDEVSWELCRAQDSHASLRADAEKAQEQQQQMAELHSKLQSSEAEVRSKCEELSGLHGQLQEARTENSQLTERIRSIEALLEAGQTRDAQDAQVSILPGATGKKGNSIQQVMGGLAPLHEVSLLETKELFLSFQASQAEADQQQTRLKELESQVSGLEKEAAELREAVEQQKMKNNDLREKNWKAMEALATAEQACKEKLHSLTQAKEESEKQLRLTEVQTREALLALLPELSILVQQNYTEWLQELKEKGPTLLKQPPAPTEPSSDLASKLREAEETQSTLQAECDQYRSILAETEGMLRDLQKSVEEEEQVWRAKVGAAEEELQKSRATVKHLEEIVEKLKGELESSDQVREHTSHLEAELEKHMAAASAECQNYAKEVAGLRQLLLESQSQLDAAKSEAQKQSDELALVRQQLSEMKSHVEDGDIAGAPASSPEASPAEQDTVQGELEAARERGLHWNPGPPEGSSPAGRVTFVVFAQLKMQLERTEAILEDEQTQRQKLTAEFEEAQTSACRLQEELEKLRTAGPLESSETEEASQLKAGRGWGGGHTCGVYPGAGATLGLRKGAGSRELTEGTGFPLSLHGAGAGSSGPANRSAFLSRVSGTRWSGVSPVLPWTVQSRLLLAQEVLLAERLEKEKKLTSDLGRAAAKLQELLKMTQEQLAREKDTVKTLQEQLEKTVRAQPRSRAGGGAAPGSAGREP
ncbi:Ribosome-binding protein 1 [Saguinus oedipus]|uniref:Ribosome-binding protein 1 n=1 Tax=Saguinus oedipus TaxID=9490 RepID=A0ABQ9VK75_SAGOE|nr:Ribosome-binding protein 1 [Saguinus oedipus]